MNGGETTKGLMFCLFLALLISFSRLLPTSAANDPVPDGSTGASAVREGREAGTGSSTAPRRSDRRAVDSVGTPEEGRFMAERGGTDIRVDLGGVHPRAELSIAGQDRTIVFMPHSVRSPDFKVKVQLADGSYELRDPGPIRTFRGSVPGIDGSVAAGSLLDDGFHAVIVLPDGKRLWIEPNDAAKQVAGSAGHVVLSGESAPVNSWMCGLDTSSSEAVSQSETAEATGAAGVENLIYVAELVCDSDFEFFNSIGSVAGVVGRIEAIVNALNVQYERDVNIMHVLTAVLVRTAEEDPYPSTPPTFGEIHDALAAHEVRYDIAQLFSGKMTWPSGRAFLDGVCDAHLSISWVSHWASPGRAFSFPLMVDLSAHELGHTWGPHHCLIEGYECDGYTMNALLAAC